ncbi:MAG: UDP-N-acetylmuramoyl-tripeptide--D-alanyl-D-alanine ligase [Thermodesulfobacterium sp.]|nr:UDP-N-acetylmuramoyl-tripeptide--D-alanyl-D-alanine ligase [Thermodesulfobacterium sp.]
MIARRVLSTEDVVRATKGILLNGDMGITFSGVTTDSREVEPGFLFFALKGKRFDGHEFIKESIANGVKGAVVERMPDYLRWDDLPRDVSIILVKDTLFALGELARYVRSLDSYKVIAITGSCGKTTTKEMTYQILSKFYKCGKNEANFNNLIGVPMSILAQDRDKDWVILEIATNSPGEIARLTEITNPDLGAITCVYAAHLEGLKSLEGILEEKTSLFAKMKKDGTIVYFYDQENLRERVKNFPQTKISFGFEKGADLWIENFEEVKEGAKISLVWSEKKKEVFVRLKGRHQVLNFSASIAIALGTGLEFEEVCEKLPEIEEFYSRLKVIKTENLVVLDDTYNANPGSMAVALEYLENFPKGDFRKVAILGDMKELGEFAKSAHRSIGELAKKVADFAIFVGEHAEDYRAGFEKGDCMTFETTEALLEALKQGKIDLSRCVVLVKGSRAMGMERVVLALLERGR